MRNFGKVIIFLLAFISLLILNSCEKHASNYPLSPEPVHDLSFSNLALTWDEGVPLGNGLLGALIWQRGDRLRFALDRADLWDLRPVEEFLQPEFSFAWVKEHVLRKDYQPVHRLGDLPYDRDPAPTRIPAGALELETKWLGEIEKVRLSLKKACCEIYWKSGIRMTAFVQATEPVGWVFFEGPGVENMLPELIAPPYNEGKNRGSSDQDVVAGKTLASLGYPPAEFRKQENSISFKQAGWGGFEYEISVAWKVKRATSGKKSSSLTIAWSISSSYKAKEKLFPEENFVKAKSFIPGHLPAEISVMKALERGLSQSLRSHERWWQEYWDCSAIAVPDPGLEKQWFLEMYKFGSASRRGAPPVSLQAVWTADNGSLPPWKGDFHHDLNTQLSYWPCYSANHLEEGLAFLDWLWAIKPVAEEYTRRYFGVKGLNVPGVTTLDGSPMGGWIQYSLGPTVSAWLGHHFYLHWQFSRDYDFLKERAYPWVRDAAIYLDEISERRPDGKRKLPLSSSPEINDNRLEAWFLETTNFDLALIRWLYGAASEMAGFLGLKEDEARWRKILSEWPDLARAVEDKRLLVAPDYPLKESHRHFSHLMAIHPLGLIDISAGEDDKRTIDASLKELERLGPDWWCGYSYAWLGALEARARNGEKAARALKVFAECFCLPNSFHVNGDQCRSGHSRFTYRPFTLEGNFAFAASLNEMLLQSHSGKVYVFPAIPAAWKKASFRSLRSYGAWLVSSRMEEGKVVEVVIVSEKGGRLKLHNPFDKNEFKISGLKKNQLVSSGETIEVVLVPGQKIILNSTS